MQDVAFRVLETPRDDNDDIPFTDPCPFFDLALDPAHPFNTVNAADADVICPHHQLGAGKLLAILFFGQPYPDYRCTVRIKFRGSG